MVKKKKKVYSTAVLLFGILAPMPIINLFSITMYVWCIMILGMIALVKWVNKGRVKLDKQYDRAFAAVIATWVISYLICAIRMPAKWTSGIGTSFVQLCFLIIVYIFFSQKEKVQYLAYYVKGVYISSIIQMMWGYAQILFDAIGQDLNTIVFSDYSSNDGRVCYSISVWSIKSKWFVLERRKFCPTYYVWIYLY